MVTDYLHDLGVTAVELLPIHEFVSEPHLAEHGLSNYWGYNSIGFFAPHSAYSSSGDRGEQVTEFKQMVKNLHEAGIEVILDVVYNHTAEARCDRPDAELPGARRPRLLPPRAPGPEGQGADAYDDTYWDITGCGNTVDADNPTALRLILDSLRYWVTEMHVDGFRFDLMSALTRTGQEVDMAGHLLTTIGQDPVLRHVKLIAEPWDASMDGYRVGEFPPPWVEWNDQYRDTMRDFWRSSSRRRTDRGDQAGGLLGPLPRRRAVAVRLDQLHHRPRRLHPARPGVVRREAQRGQRRGQPGRLEPQPLVELRGRGRDRRPGGASRSGTGRRRT